MASAEFYELLPRSNHPYASVTCSPDSRFAIVAGRDVLRVTSVEECIDTFHDHNDCDDARISSSRTIREVATLRVAQFFSNSTSSSSSSKQIKSSDTNRPDVRDFFNLNNSHQRSQHHVHHTTDTNINITITNVAWSPFIVDVVDGNISSAKSIMTEPSLDVTTSLRSITSVENSDFVDGTNEDQNNSFLNYSLLDTLIAASASNGFVVIWSAHSFFGGSREIFSSNENNYDENSIYEKANGAVGNPEVVLSEHSRAVNSISWHPKRNGYLLTASQDSSVKLWKRQTMEHVSLPSRGPARTSWFGFAQKSKSTPSNENARASWRCIATFSPKRESIRDVKWSEYDENVFALTTDSGYLVVYDIRVPSRPWMKVAAHSGEATSVDWHPSKKFVLVTGGGRDRVIKVWDLEDGLSSTDENFDNLKSAVLTHKSDVSDTSYEGGSTAVNNFHSIPSFNLNNTIHSSTTQNANNLSAVNSMSLGRNPNVNSSFNLSNTVHTSTTQNANNLLVNSMSLGRNPNMNSLSANNMSRSPVLGPKQRSQSSSAGLGSSSRPSPGRCLCTMSISAPVTKVQWRPSRVKNSVVEHHDPMLVVSTAPISGAAGGNGTIELWSYRRPFLPLCVVENHLEGAIVDFVFVSDVKLVSFCEEFEQDSHSINRFTTAVWQHILSVGRDGKCILQSLGSGSRPIDRVPRSTIALGPASFSSEGSLQIMMVSQSVPAKKYDYDLTGLIKNKLVEDKSFEFQMEFGRKEKIPSKPPLLHHKILGDEPQSQLPMMTISPEIRHVGYLSKNYRIERNSEFKTNSSLCDFNAKVADSVGFSELSYMWGVFSVISSPSEYSLSQTPLSFTLYPTLVSVLMERAECGDVQTCVTLCEIFDVLTPEGLISPISSNSQLCEIIDVEIVREWYLSYIDILHSMYLYAEATDIIRYCKDPIISGMNKQSTTIHQSCPSCGKPMNSSGGKDMAVQRACEKCRKRVGFCFLCHEPCQLGGFVLCPGCGHGGHLKCAQSWFEISKMTVCPTGCGHECGKH